MLQRTSHLEYSAVYVPFITAVTPTVMFSASANTQPPPLASRSERLINSSNVIQNRGRESCDSGIRLAEDEALLERDVEQGILMTVCPLSNMLLCCVSEVKEVPTVTRLGE